MTESYGFGIAAMFAADAEFQISPSRASAFCSHTHEFANAINIDRDKRIARNQTARQILRKEISRIVAAHAERRLRQIIGTERKEFCGLRNLRCAQRRARQFDHCADEI